MRSGLASVLVLGACGFDAPAPMTADATASTTDAPADAPPDAPRAVNLVLPANGGALVTFSSEYCTGDTGGECAGGEAWRASNVHDGVLGASAEGKPTYTFGVWCSGARNAGSDPERFEFTFGQTSLVERVTVQNFGEGAYWTTSFQGWLRVGAEWQQVLDETLAPNEEPQIFVLGTPVTADAFALVLTGGTDASFFELGEVEVWGKPQ